MEDVCVTRLVSALFWKCSGLRGHSQYGYPCPGQKLLHRRPMTTLLLRGHTLSHTYKLLTPCLLLSPRTVDHPCIRSYPRSSLPVPCWLNLLWSTQFPCKFHIVTAVISFLWNKSGLEWASLSILLWGHFRPVLLMALPYKLLPLSLTNLCAKWCLQVSWKVRCRWENSRKGP